MRGKPGNCAGSCLPLPLRVCRPGSLSSQVGEQASEGEVAQPSGRQSSSGSLSSTGE